MSHLRIDKSLKAKGYIATMSYQQRVYTIREVLGITVMTAVGTYITYAIGRQQSGLASFMENWGFYIGLASTVMVFLYGLSIVGRPFYDNETNEQLEYENDLAELEWMLKSPEERAIIIAAKENQLLQLTQILQNNTIIRNQEQLKSKLRS